MRSVFGPVVRPIVYGMTILTVLAIALGRGAPQAIEARNEQPIRYHGVDWYLCRQDDPVPRLLDAETGTLERVPFPDDVRLEHVSCSPWRDPRGQTHLVGLWDDAEGQGVKHVSRALGLARYTFPERKALDRVPLDLIPTSIPCWYPGTVSRILLAGADGRLYRFSFDDPSSADSPPDDLGRPRPLVWRGRPPGGNRVWLADPCWPRIGALRDTIIVSLMSWPDSLSAADLPCSQLWWLRLDEHGTTIEDAGPISAETVAEKQRWPALAAAPDGRLSLAYLVLPEGRSTWELRIAPVDLDGNGIPHAGRAVAVSRDDCLPRPPVFSSDGRWLNVVTRQRRSENRAARFPVSELMATARASSAPLASVP